MLDIFLLCGSYVRVPFAYFPRVILAKLRFSACRSDRLVTLMLTYRYQDYIYTQTHAHTHTHQKYTNFQKYSNHLNVLGAKRVI
jgi:hypothetical protein